MLQPFPNKKPLLSIVIPCFNDEVVLPITHAAITTVLDNADDFEIEVIYVDDGSRDRTLNVLDAVQKLDNRVQVVSLSRNFGQQAATTAGIACANGDAIAIMDSDLQDPPENLIPMFRLWQNGNDVVYGVRRKRKESLAKKIGYSSFYKLLQKLADIPIPADSGDFSIIGRNVINVLNLLPEKKRFVRGLRALVGFRQIGFEYERSARAAGKSQYSLRKIIALATDGLFNFSTAPLSLITLTGTITALVSFASAILFLSQRAFKFHVFGYSPADVPGTTAIVVLTLFLSGIQLMGLGIVGEYIGRIYYEVKGRPAYLIKLRLHSRYAQPVEQFR